jgi:hypothetical protein
MGALFLECPGTFVEKLQILWKTTAAVPSRLCGKFLTISQKGCNSGVAILLYLNEERPCGSPAPKPIHNNNKTNLVTISGRGA